MALSKIVRKTVKFLAAEMKKIRVLNKIRVKQLKTASKTIEHNASKEFLNCLNIVL